MIFRRQFAELAAAHPDRLRVVHALTREPNLHAYAGEVRAGRVNDALLRELIPDPSAVQVFCCGPGITKFDKEAAKARGEQPPPRFLESALASLAAVGVKTEQIHRESYG